jgi:hypothetical protein
MAKPQPHSNKPHQRMFGYLASLFSQATTNQIGPLACLHGNVNHERLQLAMLAQAEGAPGLVSRHPLGVHLPLLSRSKTAAANLDSPPSFHSSPRRRRSDARPAALPTRGARRSSARPAARRGRRSPRGGGGLRAAPARPRGRSIRRLSSRCGRGLGGAGLGRHRRGGLRGRRFGTGLR